MRGSARVLMMFLAVVTLLGAMGCGAARLPEAGEVAPDFTLVGHDGKPVSLKSFRGQWVVLYFYPANFTGNGKKQARAFQADFDQYRKANASILGVCVEEQPSNQDFASAMKLGYKLLSDPDAEVSGRYGSKRRYHMLQTLSARNTFVIDPRGNVAKVFVHVDDTERHSSEVLAALQALQHPRS